MSGQSSAILLDYLTRRYASLKERVARVLGSGDRADDALHDAWMKLRARDEPGPVRNPGAYLVRMAVNIAVDEQRRHSRVVSLDEVQEAFDSLADPAPGPGQAAAARIDLQALAAHLEQLPRRRRSVVLMVHWEGYTQRETAERLGVSVRSVEYELKRAYAHLAAAMADGREAAWTR